MKKFIYFLFFSAVLLFGVVGITALFIQGENTPPVYMQESLENAIENNHPFIISSSESSYSIQDLSLKNIYFVSPNSQVSLDEYVGKEVHITGDFEVVDHVSFADNPPQVSAVAVRIDSVTLAQE